MKIEKTMNASAVMIILTGQLDMNDSKELSRIMNEKIERDVVIFDLSKVTYLSSSVLGEMVAIRSRLNSTTNMEPIIVGCNEQIFNLFELTGVSHFFKFVR